MTRRPPSVAYEVTRLEEVAIARAGVRREVAAAGGDELADAVALVASELITNALLHGGGWAGVSVTVHEGCARLSVFDHERRAPIVGVATESAMTGRGLRLVAAYAKGWGVTPLEDGKEVWAEITGDVADGGLLHLFDNFDDDVSGLVGGAAAAEPRYIVTLGDVPTGLLLAAKAHVDNLVREFTLAESGAESGVTASIPAHLATLIESVVNRFSDARDSIKRQAIDAHHRGLRHTHLELRLPASAAAAGEAYLAGLDEVDVYCRAQRLLTLETPAAHRVFRHWYVGELIRQLDDAVAGRPSAPPQTFEECLADALTEMSRARWASDRAARLYAVAEALGGASTAEEVAQVALTEGVAALAASGGGILLATDAPALAVPGTVGYSDDVVARLQSEPPDAALPAASALRTGESVWLESAEDRDARFPELVGMEASTQSMCAVPLVSGNRRLGALRFSFDEPRLFDAEQRGFVLALASLCAQALDRALATGDT